MIAALSTANAGAQSANPRIAAIAEFFILTSHCELIQPFRHEPDDHRKPVREDQDSDEDEQRAGEHLAGAYKALISCKELKEGVNAESRQHERDSQAERIDEQEPNALVKRPLLRGQRQDRGQD